MSGSTVAKLALGGVVQHVYPATWSLINARDKPHVDDHFFDDDEVLGGSQKRRARGLGPPPDWGDDVIAAKLVDLFMQRYRLGKDDIPIYQFKELLEFGLGTFLIMDGLEAHVQAFLKDELDNLITEISLDAIKVLGLKPSGASVSAGHGYTDGEDARPSEIAARQMLRSCLVKALVLEQLANGLHLQPKSVQVALMHEADSRVLQEQGGVVSLASPGSQL